MKFVVGEIPKNSNCSFEEYTRLNEPEKSKFMRIAGFSQLLLWVSFYFAWSILEPNVDGYFYQTSILGYFAILLIIFPVHEIFHAMLYPMRNHKRIVFGVWPKMGVCYAMYDGSLSRNRWLAVYGAPFILISLVPFLCGLYFDMPSWLIIASLLNAGFSAGDLVAMVMIYHQVPRQAIIAQNGWDTYWRSTVNKSIPPTANAAAD